ncbi:hypothetical protein [Thalassoroseus pseudoceratinae]|uniref:hypothetical protein n=1 Tax=Thalassoroseus pseudoceratinae TaxID=2713176 RepID=UPI00141F9C02|nr:hypothetical protein [Thalassoroseus pseudoceratinae]
MSRIPLFNMTLVVVVCVWGGLPLSKASAQQSGSVPNEPITEAQPLPSYGNTNGVPAPEVLPESVLSSSPSVGETINESSYPMTDQGFVPVGVGDPVSVNGMHLPGNMVVPPYYNWHRVVRRPIWRTPVVYNRYWPNHYYTGGQAWSGRGAAQPLPVVSHPTDTTQMGVYYQQVPMWQPNPRMVPPTPWPWDWHYTMPAQAVYARQKMLNSGHAGFGVEASLTGYGSGYEIQNEEGVQVDAYESE